ncbi:uncharacterized protein ARMOST_16450 [Armillaria ostoyae]|uniref:Uncharacterized protein n=1 Tax=Armillaria ostoyae TaxID=47428 RepID=A0A284RW80_ARMOS|nr:uncharacterized protein ARMOST_16450 [Armillaria ostoyae]
MRKRQRCDPGGDQGKNHRSRRCRDEVMERRKSLRWTDAVRQRALSHISHLRLQRSGSVERMADVGRDYGRPNESEASNEKGYHSAVSCSSRTFTQHDHQSIRSSQMSLRSGTQVLNAHKNSDVGRRLDTWEKPNILSLGPSASCGNLCQKGRERRIRLLFGVHLVQNMVHAGQWVER